MKMLPYNVSLYRFTLTLTSLVSNFLKFPIVSPVDITVPGRRDKELVCLACWVAEMPQGLPSCGPSEVSL